MTARLDPPDWALEGEDPDYRFSLANERTFLAWMRTALALVAGSLAVVAFLPTGNLPWLRETVAAVVAVGAVGLAVSSYTRWRDNEIAMRHRSSLPFTRLPVVMTVFLGVGAVLVLVALLSFR